MDANPLAVLLKRKQKDFVDLLVSQLNRGAFDNSYTIHPRRLAELGAELAARFLLFVDSPRRDDAYSFGQSAAREGVGRKTIVHLAFALHRFCAEQLRADASAEPAHFDVIDSFAAGVLEGFINARESQILSDQEQIRRALVNAQQGR
ncbi:MAG: hypothetical protein ABSG21_13630 [Spirochaetia bacterium]|jgi:hypothetical protein